MDRYAAWAERPHSQRYDRVFAQRVCWMLYEAFDARALHDLGLTEPVLARVVMPSTRPGHKHGLIPLAHDLARIQQGVRGTPRPGLARAAIGAGVAAPWIRENLATIELIERKAYNRHAWLENIGLALQFPARIETPEAR